MLARVCFVLVLSLFHLLSFSQSKINGISIEGTSQQINASHFDPIINVHANWIALIPFAYISNDSPDLIYQNIGWQWWGERIEGIESMIIDAKSKDLQVMIKPQIWIMHGEFTGDFQLNSENEWQIFERKYEAYILDYAVLCEKHNIEMFCIGTELDTFAELRPRFWSNLIEKVRMAYSGELTYASNWDRFAKISFWDQLDCIGIDAYFPICEHETPSIISLQYGWKSHLTKLEELYECYGKQIVFTEWGYRSVDHCAAKPWDYDQKGLINLDAQAFAYSAVFDVVWDKPWFGGGFVWKWNPLHSNSGGENDDRFTPQNKPAQEVLKSKFKQYND